MAQRRKRLRLGVLAGVLVVSASMSAAVAVPVTPDDRPGSVTGTGTPPGPAFAPPSPRPPVGQPPAWPSLWPPGWQPAWPPAWPAWRAPGAVSGRSWGWPLEPAPAVVRRFEPPPTPWGAGHRGVDLLARVDQPVLAAGDGVVSYSGVLAGRGVVAITHDGGLRTTYEPVGSRVPEGTKVTRGTPIGTVASTPRHCAPATCLHWGLVRGTGPDQTYLDPLTLLAGALDPPVLLPLSEISPGP